jgi:hypothetical protein
VREAIAGTAAADTTPSETRARSSHRYDSAAPDSKVARDHVTTVIASSLVRLVRSVRTPNGRVKTVPASATTDSSRKPCLGGSVILWTFSAVPGAPQRSAAAVPASRLLWPCGFLAAALNFLRD